MGASVLFGSNDGRRSPALVRSEEVGFAGISSGKPEEDVFWRHWTLSAGHWCLRVPGLRIPGASDGELCAVPLGHGLGFGVLFFWEKIPTFVQTNKIVVCWRMSLWFFLCSIMTPKLCLSSAMHNCCHLFSGNYNC